MIIDQLFTRPVFEAADPSRLIVSVRIEPMSTGGEPIDKEVDLTGQFQGSMGSQMNQALDYMKKMLESKDLYFTTLKVSYQGRILNMQNRGAMSPQSDEEREMDAMANQIRAKRQITTPTMKEEAPMASPEQIAYNQLRAQWNGYQAMTSGGGNTYVSRDPAHAAKLATIPAQLAKMAAALKAKGIDAEAEYDAIGGPKSAPVDINQVYGGVAEGKEQQWTVTVGTKTGGTSHTMTFSGTKEQAIKKAVARFGTSKNPVVNAVPAKQGVAEGSLEEDKGMTGYNAFKREWRAKHGADAKVPAYDSKEYTSYVYRQNDKKQGVAEGLLGSDPNRGQKVPGWAKGGIIGKIGRKLDPAWSDIQMTVPRHLLSKQSSVPDKKSLATKDMPKAKATSITPTRAIPKRAGTNPSHPVTKNVVKTIADKSGVAEGNEWQGNRGNSQAGITDHTFDEAKQYIKGNYPFHKTYNVSRVEPGMRYHANPEKVANKTQSLVKGIDSALDYLQVKQNPMMSGSTQVTPSIGYSWHTHESRANGIAVLYYEDRGMGNDTITIAAKDRNNLKGAVQVCRDAGVIPPPKVKKQGMAEGSDRVDSLVTDALKIMRGPEMSDAVLALKRVLGDRAYNERRGFYSFYVDKIHHMYGQQGMAEAFANPGSGSTGTSRGAKRIANTVRKALAKNSETPDQIAARKDFEAQTDARMRQKKKEQGVAESNTLMKKLHQALLQEGRVKELADDLKTLNDAEFMKKYGKNKAAIRRDMKKVDEGNANSGRRGPNSPPDNTPVKLGRVQKVKTGIKHHADSSRYGGTVPDTDNDHLLSPASRHRLHKAVTPDQQDLDEGNMPQSVIKSKQKYADMSDQEFHAAHKNKSEDDLKSMAWRHGYGKGSNHYVNRHKKGGGQLNELSTDKLAQYKTAAAADAKKADQAGDVKRGDKRFSGIVKATKKQFDNDAKKIDESRRARQALMAQIVNSR